MENLINLLQQRENYDEIKAQKKLSLYYVKARAAGITTFLDEFFEWMLVTKNMNYKDIFKLTDHDLHDLYFDEYKK